MDIENGYFYFIKDEYFMKYDDPNLMKNKENGNMRPCYYCIKDNNSEIKWLIPISSKVEKYDRIYEKKLSNLKKIDTLVKGKVFGTDRYFLIQNMFPIIDKYIQNIYIKNNTNVSIAVPLKNEIEGKTKIVLNMVKHGKNIVFPDILTIQKGLIEELGLIAEQEAAASKEEAIENNNKTFELENEYINSIVKYDNGRFMYVDSYNSNGNFEAYELKEKESILSYKLDIDKLKFQKGKVYIDFNSRYILDSNKIDTKVMNIDKKTTSKIVKFKNYLECKNLININQNINLQTVDNMQSSEIEMR